VARVLAAHLDRRSGHGSKGMRLSSEAEGAARALRVTAAVLALAGALLLLLATVATVVRVRVGPSATVLDRSGWDRHGPALILLAIAAAALAAAALRGARPAAAALALVALATLLVVLLGDLPDLHDTGELGLVYEGSVAGPGAGWYAETAGAIALLVSGALLVALGAPPPTERAPRRPAASADS
jgi:hypothetical protein